MKVFVYFNSIKNLLSVRALEGEQKGSVVAHVERIALKDVQFGVHDSGLRRPLETSSKDAYAGIVGVVEALWGAVPRGDIDNQTIRGLAVGKPWLPLEGGERVRYNPHDNDIFVNADTGAPVTRAARAHLDRRSIVAAGLQ